MLLLSAVVACLTALPLDEPAAQQTFHIAATDVQIRLPLPGYTTDDDRLQVLRKSSGEHALAAGTLTSKDVRVTILGGPAPKADGAELRQGILGSRLLGMGLSTVSGFASAQTIRALNPPYREFDRHVFLTGADAMAHVQVIALEQEDPEKFGDAGFAAIAAGARFAVVRRTAWDDLPASYLELSHAASQRADGAAWLAGLALAPEAGWATKLAALEHAHAARSTDPSTIVLGTALLDELSRKAERTRAEDAGLLLVEDGLGLALLRAGRLDEADPHLAHAAELAAQFGPRTVAGVAVSRACARAARADADGVVALLDTAYATDPAQRYRLQRETLLDPVRKDPRVDERLKIVLKAPSNRSLGGH